MTEEQKAQTLAQWLEDPTAPFPSGLDPEVLEAMGVLRPEWVPAPRVTSEEILGDSLRAGEGVVDLGTVRSKRLPLWAFFGGLGGVGAMAAAALALFAVFPMSTWVSNDATMPHVIEARPDIAAMPQTEEASSEADEAPQESKGDVAVEDPKALLAADLDSEARAPVPPEDDLAAKGSPSSPAPPPENSRAAKPAPVQAPVPLFSDRARTDAGSYGSSGASSGGAAPSSRSRPSAKKKEVRESYAEADAVEMMAAPEPEVVDLETLRSQVLVHLGPFPELGANAAPEVRRIHDARTAMETGDLLLAEQHAREGLALGSGPTAERRWLTFLLAEVLRERGQHEHARATYKAALRGEVD